MKILAIFLIIAVASVISLSSPTEYDEHEFILRQLIEKAQDKQLSVDANEYLDNTLKIIQLLIVKNGMDPLQIENLEKGFSIKMGLVTVHGEFVLDHGWLQGLNTVERGGNAYMNYANKNLQLWLPLSFKTMLVDYDYKIKFMNLGPTGGVEGKISNLKLLVDISIDTTTLEIKLKGFSIPDSGKINVRFSGHPITDILVNMITKLAMTMLHEVALKVVQTQVREALENAIEGFNNSIKPKEMYML